MLDLVNEKIEEVIRQGMVEQGVPGLAAAVIVDQTPIFVQGFGVADCALGTPVTDRSVFQIASLTKQFTSMLVLMLAHKGLIGLDDAISNWLPEGGSTWSMISVRHLMAHLSGISDEPMDDLDDQRDFSEDEFVATIAGGRLLWQPGTKWDYCNSGYVLLGAIIHRVTGKPWYDAMQERIFGPLGMISARVVDEVWSEDRVVGYEMEKGILRPQAWIAPSHNRTADGGLLMCAQDFVAWAAALGSDKLLPQHVIQQLWQPCGFRNGTIAGTPDLRFGLGWMLAAEPGMPRVARHQGAWQGFSTSISRLLDEKVTVVVLTNLDDEFSHLERIVREILLEVTPRLQS